MELAAIERDLLATGGPFEIEEALVRGERLRVFRRRPRSLREMLAASSALGDAEHLVFTDGARERRIGFRGHARLVASVAEAMRATHGIGPGDRVAILAANCPEWVLAFWATVSLGAIAVGLNAWWTGPEIRAALADSAPRLLVADRKRLARLDGKGPGVPTVVVEDHFAALERHSPDAALSDIAIDEDDDAILLYTSGTTARPKGVVHTHRNVASYVMLAFFHGARMARVREATGCPAAAPGARSTLVTSPLFHVSGLHSAAVTGLAAGVRTVFTTGRFDARTVMRVIERERISAWSYTRTLLHRVVHHPDVGAFDLSSVTHIGGGGSPIPPALQARAREIFTGARATFGVGYGLTECTALATLAAGEELRAFPSSVGRPLPTVELEIRDDRGATVGEGVEGEVHVRGPLVMRAYWRDPAATSASLLPGGWLRTGDIGALRDGRLTLSCRRRDLILRGGENISPDEIEERIERHAGVAEAAAVGVAHDELGQEVKAIVVPKPGVTLDVHELRAWVAADLAYFKVPALWEIRDAPLPRNATGKLLRNILREGAPSAFVDE
ncbi:MAG: long-chain fatty acid--CoA ligase [Thermoleophilia bacterium]|nr:long-chain fatty acid--CoA ligase [Thermoleophilia bacterium]